MGSHNEGHRRRNISKDGIPTMGRGGHPFLISFCDEGSTPSQTNAAYRNLEMIGKNKTASYGVIHESVDEKFSYASYKTAGT
jgi:hypothetical protein